MMWHLRTLWHRPLSSLALTGYAGCSRWGRRTEQGAGGGHRSAANADRHRGRHRTPTLPLLLSAALAGCTVGPDFRRPEMPPPAVWGTNQGGVPSTTVQTAFDPSWWRSFGDPELSSLMSRLVAQNIGLQTAMERVLQGRSQRLIAASQGLPHIREETHYYHERQSPKGFVSLVQPSGSDTFDYDDYFNGLRSSWELDLFGRVRRGVEAADAQTLASVENRRGIAVAALAELAQDYLQLRGTQRRLSIAEDNLRLARENTRLVQNRVANGVANKLERAQAAAQQASIEGLLPPLRAQQAALINAIGLLLAEPPQALAAELQPRAAIPPAPPVVPIGVPGELVRRRPDVAEAEARLHAATAQTGVATANFYPDISLTGVFDLDGRNFKNAFSLPDRAFQIGPTLSIPVFEGGRLRGELRVRESQQREAALQFRQTVLQAWQEVDNALTAYAETQRRRATVAEAMRQDRIALTAARDQFNQGAADFLNVVSSQSQLLQEQNNLAASDIEVDTDLVTLYRALGGGWQVTEPGSQPETTAAKP